MGNFGVVRIQNGRISFGLIFKHACFRAAILFERSMTVEVILREIEQSGDIRAERRNGFELEAAGLNYSET